LISIYRSPVKTGFFILSLCLLFPGCNLGTSRLYSKPVVQVNDQALSAKDFSDQLARRLKSFDALAAKDPNNVKRSKEDVIRVFILQALTNDYAKANQLAINDSELEKEINVFRSSYPDDISFRRVLADENLSMSDWKEELRQTLLSRKVFQKVSEKITPPTPEEIHRYYEDNKNLFKRKERVYLRQIIIDELSKAQSIRDELRKKEFTELARKYSVAPEGKNGGLVGWVEKGSVDIFDKAFNLPIGGLSQVLESSYGFHIFKVERKTGPGFASIEEVKKEIVQAISGKKEQAEFSAWLDKQIRASKVMRDNDLLSAITVETRGQK
jgi:peptidyl-prolyl cis-trans isomerase C